MRSPYATAPSFSLFKRSQPQRMQVKAKRVLYCTGNTGKFGEGSQSIAAVWPELEVVQRKPSVVEVQGSAHDIARAKVASARAELARHEHLDKHDVVLAEDVSLELDSLGGFPGPYVKPMLEAISDSGLASLAQRLDSQHCTARCTVGVAPVSPGVSANDNNSSDVLVFSGSLRGQIIDECRGSVKHGNASWNACFVPDGMEKTFGELSWSKQSVISHRFKALKQVCDHLLPPR